MTADPPDRPTVECQRIKHACECGETHTLNVRHYQTVTLECGRKVWALQPKRKGPFKMFPYLGERA